MLLPRVFEPFVKKYKTLYNPLKTRALFRYKLCHNKGVSDDIRKVDVWVF